MFIDYYYHIIQENCLIVVTINQRQTREINDEEQKTCDTKGFAKYTLTLKQFAIIFIKLFTQSQNKLEAT